MSRTRNWLALAGWIALSGVAGAVGGLASVNAREFYQALVQPPWAPPGWLFGPVWTALYGMMGISAWLVWRARPADAVQQQTRRGALWIFVGQLVLNALWSWLFFGWRMGGAAFAEIIALWIMIAVTIRLFAQVHSWAAWLLVPYLGWVTFAAALNVAIWQLNPDRL